MECFKNLIIVGTSHVAQQSLKEVSKAIIKNQPEVVAIELDRKRFLGLIKTTETNKDNKDPNKQADKQISKETKENKQTKGSHLNSSSLNSLAEEIKTTGFKVFIINRLGAWVEKKIGKLTGVQPGSEMKLAATLAEETGAKIALIDRDITITLKRLLKSLTPKEKWQFIKDIFNGLTKRSKAIKIDLRKVPENYIIDKMIKEVKKKYPSVYKVLIDERNLYMAKNLYKLMGAYDKGKIVAVVGAGHVEGIINLIRKWSEDGI